MEDRRPWFGAAFRPRRAAGERGGSPAPRRAASSSQPLLPNLEGAATQEVDDPDHRRKVEVFAIPFLAVDDPLKGSREFTRVAREYELARAVVWGHGTKLNVDRTGGAPTGLLCQCQELAPC